MSSRTLHFRRTSFFSDNRGAAAMEMALVLPALVFILVTAIEMGVIAMFSTGLDNAVFDVARLIRTGQSNAPVSADGLKSAICDGTGGLLPDCMTRLTVSAQKFSRFADVNAVASAPPDGTFNKGAAGDIVMIKASYVWPVISPFVGAVNQPTAPSQIAIGSRTAFKNEPFG